MEEDMGVLGVRGLMFGGGWIKTYIKISSLKSLVVVFKSEASVLKFPFLLVPFRALNADAKCKNWSLKSSCFGARNQSGSHNIICKNQNYKSFCFGGRNQSGSQHIM